MSSNMKGVGFFTAGNIGAVLKALPETDATCDKVITRTREYGGQVSEHTPAHQLAHGRADIKARKHQMAFARFAQKYDQIKSEHCTDVDHNQEFDRALKVLERTCEWGNEKTILPDWTLGDACREREDIEEQRQRRP